MCGRTACTVREGGTGEVESRRGGPHAPEGKPPGLSPSAAPATPNQSPLHHPPTLRALGYVRQRLRHCSALLRLEKFRESVSWVAQLLVPATFLRSVSAALGEKCSGHSFRTEGVHRRVLPVLGDDRSLSFRLLTTIPPVDPDRPPFIAQPLDHRVVATLRHHRANWPSNSTHERPSGANPPRRTEDDNCVGSLQAKIERFVIVAVGDPAVARKQTALLHPPLVIRRADPAWLPIMEVEMDQR